MEDVVVLGLSLLIDRKRLDCVYCIPGMQCALSVLVSCFWGWFRWNGFLLPAGD
jgi:hypothetical protein